MGGQYMFMWVCESTLCTHGVDARDLSHLSPPVTFHINFGNSFSLNLELIDWLGCLPINLQESTCLHLTRYHHAQLLCEC